MNYKEEALKMIEQGRVVFPLTDMDGNITGVTGKLTLKKDPTVPTYVVRGTGFFGNFNTERDEIIVTEGTVAVLMAQTYKYDNVISCLHAANWKKVFTDDVLARLAETNKKIIIFFDNDDLGQKNAKTLCAKMKEYRIDVYNYQSDKAVDFMEFLAQGHSIETIINSTKEMFATGFFSMEGNAVQTFHYADNPGKHEVVSDIEERKKRASLDDGYVSNEGSVATIHIKPEYNNETNVEWVKRIFGLYEKYGITEVRIEEIPESL